MRLLTFTFVLLLARSLTASPILTVDYETGELTSGIPGIGATMPLAADAMTINSNIVRSGSYSFRSKVQHNTNYISDGNYRAEEDTIGVLPTHYNWGDRVNYQFSICLDSSWQSDNRNSDYIVHQWKRYNLGPDMFVDVKGTDIVLRVGTNYQMTILYNYSINKWIDFKLDVSWATDATGSADVYYKYSTNNNFTYVGTYNGYTMQNDLLDNGYLKWGIYAPGLDYSNFTNDPNHAWIVYHDNFIVTPISCTLTYTAGSNGTISGTSPQTVSYGTNGTAVTAVPNTGYRFVNWSDGSITNPRTDSVVTNSLRVTANFAANAANAVLQWTTTSNSITDGSGTWNQNALSITAGTGAWYDGTNYGQTMNSGDTVTFGGGTAGAAATLTIGTGGVTPGDILFFNANGGGSYVLGASGTGPAITMNGGVITNGGSANPTISCPLNGSFTYGAPNKSVVFAGNGNQTATNNVTIVAGSTLQLGNNSAAGSLGAAVITNNGTLQWRRNGANTVNISNVVYGTGDVTIYGDGATYVIYSNLYYAGSTTLKAYNSSSTKCLVQLGSSNVLPTNTALIIAQNASPTNYSIFDLNGYNQMVGSLAGDANATATSEVVTNSSATLATLTLGGTNKTTGFGGLIAGNLSLVLNGIGSTLTLSNNANTYSGGTTINAGKLQLNSAGAFPGNALTVNGGVLGQNGNAISVTTLNGSGGTITNAGLAVTGGGSFAGAVAGGGALTNSGGTLILSGTNTYTGATIVAAGNLVINGSLASGSAVTVAPAGTLGGGGTVSGPVTVNGSIAPGTGVGTLNTGPETWNSGGSYVCEINATNTTGCDRLNLTGNLNVQSSAGSRFTIKLVSLTSSNTPGLLAQFNKYTNYTWTIATASGGVSNFATNKFALDTSSLSNDFSGGAFAVALAGNNLVINYTAAPAVASPFQISMATWGSGGMQVGGTGTVGRIYILLATTNLAPAVWSSVATNPADGNGVFQFADVQATNYNRRFYRVVTP